MPRRRWFYLLAILTVAGVHPSLQTPTPPLGGAPRTDYLTFAQGAMPLRVSGTAAQLGAGDEQALRAVDGSGAAFTLASDARSDTTAEFTYELPASTTFDRLAVPNVIDAPAAAVTFVRDVEVLGSSSGPGAGYTLLASATLTPHLRRGELTELPMVELKAVRWIKVRLIGGLDMTRGESAIEFTEIIGNGMQEPAATSYRFRGEWSGSGVTLALRQQGAVVSGCYDAAGELAGTVSGNILRAIGTNRTDRVTSAFVLGVAPDGTLRGVRATGKGPFKPYTAPKNAPGLAPRCTPPPVKLSCGAVVHAVAFSEDGAALRPESATILEALADGLRTAPAGPIVVESHAAAGDGAAAGQALSERRAQAVADDLAGRGVAADRLRASGVGSARPLFTGDDEATRVINRRLEIRCQ